MSSNKEKVAALIASIETGDQTPVSYINPQKYIQHNLGAADGLKGFGALLAMLPKGKSKAKPLRVFQDGDYVFTHTDYNFFGPKVGFDVFRFEDGLIVEHWDNLAEKAESTNPSGRSQLDGATEVEDVSKTAANKEHVSQFIAEVLVEGKFDKLASYISPTTYLQHNTGIADGLAGLAKGIEELGKQGIKMIYTKCHKVLGEGNFVLTISEGTFGDKPTSYYDLFRLSDGLIVEHWDIIETIPPKSEWKNDNGKFGF